MVVIKPPQLPKPLPAKAISLLENHFEYSAALFTGIDLSLQVADDVLFEQTHLQRIIFQRTQLKRPRLFDVRASSCDLSGAEWEKARFRRVEFIACRLLGIQFLDAHFEQVIFKECNLEGAVLAGAIFKFGSFVSCNLRNSSFEQANCSEVIFQRCDLAGANFAGARLVGADLRGSQLNGLKIHPVDITGAVIETSQAALLIALLGVHVDDRPF